MTILALYSNKGGVGKTAAAVNLAYLSAQSGIQTLLCDLDAQSSATFYLRAEPRLKSKARGLSEASQAIEDSIKPTSYPNLHLLPGDLSHRNLELVYDRLKHRRRRLQEALKPLEQTYGLIFIDSPPGINILSENIFNASDLILTPVIPTILSLNANKALFAFLRDEGYDAGRWHSFFSMVDRRKKMHQSLVSAARPQLTGLLESAIPYASQVEQMGAYRAPLPVFAARSPAAQAYQDLWEELARKIV